MIQDKIFFSYSRADSAFVLKLAKDLRDAGIDLWLDQLDIQPGSHWDSSIQAALNESHSLIIVLSKTSVASENVMDEVSFALENNKTVIPVIIAECTPPFRLSRLQRIDFIQDYQTGLNQLLETLKELESEIGTNTSPSPESISSKNQTPETDTKDKELERLMWEKAKKENSLSSYTHYLDEYPNGAYRSQAFSALDAIHKNKQAGTIPKKLLFAGAGAILLIAIALYAYFSYDNNQPKASPAVPAVDEIAKAEPAKIPVKASQDMDQATLDSIVIGHTFRGGIIFYIDGTKLHGLIAAPYDQSDNIEWNMGSKTKCNAYGTGIGEGAENTRIITEKTGEGNYPAKLCADLEYKGYNDWYLPSKDELQLLYKMKDVIKGFADAYYWSSSEASNADVWYQSFFNGVAYKIIEHNKAHVRAIRAF